MHTKYKMMEMAEEHRVWKELQLSLDKYLRMNGVKGSTPDERLKNYRELTSKDTDIKIKYFSDDYPRLEKISKGDWIDLRVDSLISTVRRSKLFDDVIAKIRPENMVYQKGDIIFVGLGVAMELPKEYEAYIVPRSSTFKNTGLILTNNVGIIDNSYSGNNDEWRAMFYATRDGVINRHDRLLQFRIQEKMPELNFIEVDKLSDKNRGGYGTTGIK